MSVEDGVIRVRMRADKVTPGTVRYAELSDPGDIVALATQYIKKPALEAAFGRGEYPGEITVTIEVSG